jgi:hypothetical protein
METRAINWLELDNSQKSEVLHQAKTFLQQQLAEVRVRKKVIEILTKNDLL